MTLKRAWVILGLVTIITSAVAIVRSKIAAILLGPEGIGLYAQGTIIISFGATICTLGMGQGIVKHLAERQNGSLDAISRRQIISTSIILQLAVAIVLVAAIFIFSYSIDRWIFGEGEYNRYVSIAALAVPVTLLYLNFGYILQGFGQVAKYSIGSIAFSIAGLAVFAILVFASRLDGAMLSLLITPLAGIIILAFLTYRPLTEAWAESGSGLPSSPYSLPVAKILIIYGAVAFIGASLDSLNIVVLRSWIVNVSGPEQNGIYQAVVTMTGQYIGFFSLFNSTYLFPKISALADPEPIGIEINKALQLTLLVITPMLGLILIFRQQIILLLFTPAFLTASNVLVWQVMGDALRVSSWTISSALLPTGKLKHYLAISIIYVLLSLALSIVLLNDFGILGIAMAHFAVYAIHIVIVIFIQRRILSLQFASRTLRLAAASVLVLLLTAFMPNESPIAYALKTALLVIWTAFALWEMRTDLRSLHLFQRFAKILP